MLSSSHGAAARLAQEGRYDYFTTTLSISPLKNAGKINEIGQELAQIYQVEHLPLILRKRMDINVLLSFPMSMDCTDRITADVFFQKKKVWRGRSKKQVTVQIWERLFAIGNKCVKLTLDCSKVKCRFCRK